MIVAKDKVVSLSYQLKVNGEMIDEANAQNPLVFLFGHGQLIPRFEQNIDGLKIGDKFEFSISAAEGYGEVNDMAIVELPKDVFMMDGELPDDLLEVGRRLPMRDSEGNTLDGLIVEINDDAVVMDFNHPLAGEDLHFIGSVEAVREASAEELAHGHIHNHNHNEGECADGNCGEEETGGCCGCGGH
ncbi:MAG TPA: peptidylprolyl isomerase [Tenuifilaceae bacterium]|nr:peptidylprolyl isomerase [Tenuifilaceae bacterium]